MICRQHTKIRINILISTFLLLGFSLSVHAQDLKKSPADHNHGSDIWHMFRLEVDYGAGVNAPVASWDLDGWVGTDENKLWIKPEGDNDDGTTERAEFWAMYSRNISTFWDVQAGVRYDTQPDNTSYMVLGFVGLAPYFFETEAHMFISDHGDVSARLRQEIDFLVTQRLIIQPYGEINVSAQDAPEQNIGAGLTRTELGLQSRYEITRKIAPYVDIYYEQKYGETSSIARHEEGYDNNLIASLGLRFMF